MATDAELLRESRRRPDAYVEVCERHINELFAWLKKQVGATEAEDILAETLARGWYARRRYNDPGHGSAGAWLQGIARNVLREHRRRGAAELRAAHRLGLRAVTEHSVNEEAHPGTSDGQLANLRPSLRRLPDEQRAALELRVVNELAYNEIAAEQGISVGTARTRVHRALTSLRLSMKAGNE